MTQNKTKKAFLMSVLSMMLCVAMLVGMTFAWFTDTASTSVNTIQAGNLKIEVAYRTSADGEWLPLNEATDLFGNETALYEPGYTRVVELKIKNAGDLALKYKIGMNLISENLGTNMAGDSYKLSDYLKVATTAVQQYDDENQIVQILEQLIFERGYESMWNQRDFASFELEKHANGNVFNLMPGAEQILGMKIYMPETVNNDANAITPDKAASINFGLNVLATQYTYESDSINNQYDKDAEYSVSTSKALAAALEKGGDITLTDDITMTADTAQVTIPSGKNVNLDLGGNTITTNGLNQIFLASSCNMKISNGTFINSNTGRVGTVSGRLGENPNVFGEKAYVTFENVTFKNDNAGNDRGNRQIHVLENTEVKFINCTFDTYDSNGEPNRAVDVWNGARDAKVIFCEGTRSTWDYVNWYANEDWRWTPHKMVLEDGCEWVEQIDENGKTWFVVTRTTTG